MKWKNKTWIKMFSLIINNIEKENMIVEILLFKNEIHWWSLTRKAWDYYDKQLFLDNSLISIILL